MEQWERLMLVPTDLGKAKPRRIPWKMTLMAQSSTMGGMQWERGKQQL